MENSAIEWLANEFKDAILKEYGENRFLELIQQAKEMEKQQLYNFYVQGGIDCVTQADRTVEDFYNETYKNTEK